MSESVQWAMLVPLLLMLVLGLVQVGVWLHGRSAAAQAAALAAEASAGYAGTASDASARALARAAGLTGVVVSVDRSATQVRATVTGRAPLILDLGLGVVTESAVRPRERVSVP